MTYQPEIDGQAEWMTKTIEDMLQMYLGKKQQFWDK